MAEGINESHKSDEIRDWIEALENILLTDGSDHAKDILQALYHEASIKGIDLQNIAAPQFKNTVSIYEQEEYPGDLKLEEKIRHYIRWNSLLMVLKANKENDLGGHISTFSSAATLYEVGFNHFFKGGDKGLGDLVSTKDTHLLVFMQDLFLKVG